MTNRRDLLRVAALAALPLRAPSASAAFTRPRNSLAIIDGRHPEARAFGARLEWAGAELHVLQDGDVTAVWSTAVRQALARGKSVVSGLTRSPALFVLEQLAWPQRFRVVYQAEHVIRRGAPASHAIVRGSRRPQLGARALARQADAWPRAVADLVLSQHAAMPQAPLGPTDAGLYPARLLDEEFLTSWTLAPL
jgi:hypothetical protein